MIQVEKKYRSKFRRSGLFRYCEYIKSNFNIIRGDSCMVEVGSFAGMSTSVFFEYFNVTSVDPYMHGYDDTDKWSGETTLLAAKNHFARVFKGKVNQINEPSLLAADQFKDKSLDFVYIDGDHTYDGVVTDITAWIPKIKSDGIIGGHDYKEPTFPGVTKAVHEFFNPSDVKAFRGLNWLVSISKIKTSR
jgi:hypothetical protein